MVTNKNAPTLQSPLKPLFGNRLADLSVRTTHDPDTTDNYGCRNIVIVSSRLHAQATSQKPPGALAKYFAPYAPTRLEWDLVQVNLHWMGAFGGGSDYLTSAPIIYRSDRGVFFTAFTVAEARDATDRDPFSKLADLRKRAVMQSGLDQLIMITKTFFPEVEQQPGLLTAAFWYRGALVGVEPLSDDTRKAH